MTDRTQPHDIEAEQCALGGMLLSAAAIDDVTAILASRDYYRPAHALIHDAIVAMHERGEPADAVTVAAELTRAGDISRVQGAPYLHTLIASVPTAANAAWYARIVRERAILRRLIETGTRIVQLGYSADGDAGDLAALAESELAKVLPAADSGAPLTSGDVYVNALRRLETPEDKRGMIAPPWDDLRDLIPVFRPGQLITIGARPGTGKSIAASDILRYVGLKLRLPSILFSLEMTEAEVTDRMLAAEASVSLSRIQACELDDLDWQRIARVRDRFGEGTFVLDDTPGITLAHIRSRLRAMTRTAPARIALVDYLQLMRPGGVSESREREVAAMASGLKNIAREFAIPVVLLAQLNRGPEHRQDRRPTKADLRESGCMPATTRLLRADNGEEITLGELVLSQQQVEVLSVDGHQRIVPSLLTRTFPSGIKPVFRLRLRSGRELEATANHKFLTVDGWERLDSLGKGSFIATPRQLPAPMEARRQNEDELVLMAHLIGDGSIGPGVKYTTIDPANKAVVERAARNLFGIEASSKAKGRKWDLWFPSPYHVTHRRYHPMRNWLEPFGLWGTRSGNKFIPEPLFALPDDQLALFLRHLWATDGSITLRRNGRGQHVSVYYASTSRLLAENVQRALLRFEIRSCLRRSRKAGYVDCWNVAVQGSPDQRRFLERIGCHGARGDVIPEALTILGQLKPNPNIDLVPWAVSHRVKEAMRDAGISHRELAAALGETYGGSYFLGSEDRPRRFSRPRLGRMAALIGSAELKDIAESHLHWDEIVEVTALGPVPTFDATVSDTHNFIANGVVAHNSIENDSDVVILIHRPDMGDPELKRAGEADLIVDKNRAGPMGTRTVLFQGHYGRFAGCAWSPASSIGEERRPA